MRTRKTRDRHLVELARPAHHRSALLRACKIARRRRLPADLLGNGLEHAPDLALGGGRRHRQKPRPHGLGRLHQKPLEQLARHIDPQPDGLGQTIVSLGLDD